MIDEIRISYSSMKDFWECQKRYWYRVTNPKASISNIHMVFGSIVHISLERYEEKGKELNKLVGWSLHEWDRRMATADFMGGKIPKPPKSFKRMYVNYIEKIRPKLKDNPKIEHFFKLPLSYSPDGETQVYFVGKIDRKDDGGIYDWKTSERLPDRYALSDTQFFAYWWAYKIEFNADPEKIYYGHLGSGNLYNINMSHVLLRNFGKLLDKTAEVVYNSWRQEDFPRVIGYQCGKCPFRSICGRELREEEDVEDSRGIR